MKKKKEERRLLRAELNRRLETHHLLAKSRGGGDFGNTVRIPRKIHRAYHIICGNLTPEEAKDYFCRLMDSWKEEAGNKTIIR